MWHFGGRNDNARSNDMHRFDPKTSINESTWRRPITKSFMYVSCLRMFILYICWKLWQYDWKAIDTDISF